MITSLTRTNVWMVAVRHYWWLSTIGAAYFVIGFCLWHSTPQAIISSSLFFLATIAGLVLHHRVGWNPRYPQLALIVGQLLLGQAILVWQRLHLPLTDYTNSGNTANRDFLIYLASSLAVVATSIFGGVAGALASLLVHYGFIFNVHQEFSFKWLFPVFMALTGWVVNNAFWRLDRAYEQLAAFANRDQLTGLLNRHCLVSEFDRLQSIARQTEQPLLLVAWDLDGLKQVNDQQGHAAGDTYIRNFANALQANVRKAKDLRPGDAAFRVGGDEFISLHLAARDGKIIADRVQRSGTWVSAGWILCHAITLDQALTQADKALYQSKAIRKKDVGAAANCG